MDLDSVAGELYGLPPEEFTAARKVKVAEARRSGDRELAAQIGSLRRPSASAGIVNSLTRQHPDLIEELLALGDEMRQAQAALAGADLRRLSARRSDILAALVEAARAVAAEQQHPMTSQLAAEVNATLQAALADPEVAETVRAGRLTSAVHYSGFGLLPADAVVPQQQTPPKPAEAQQEGRHRARGKLRLAPPIESGEQAPAGASRQDEARHDEARRDKAATVESARDAAQARLEELAQAAAQADAAVNEAEQRRQSAAAQISELERQLTAARAAEREAATELRAREKQRDKAIRAAHAARTRLEQAQQAVDRLSRS